jgi:hypothetical protein
MLRVAVVVAFVFCLMPSVLADGAEETAVRELAKIPPKLTLESSAADVLRACREMLPMKPVELKGALILRNRRGIVSREYDYVLVMRRASDVTLLTIHLMPRGGTNRLVSVTVSRRGTQSPTIHLTKDGAPDEAKIPSLLERVMETDVTWLDLTFDFLWWTDAAYETEREGESVHGQKCSVILVRPPTAIQGLAGVRLWVDRKTGCLMQAEQLDGEKMKPMRRLWGTRVKRFDGERWMVSVLEVETLGSRHRTKITVDSLRELEK